MVTYQLKAQYVGKYSGGTIWVSGTRSFDVGAALTAGGGTISVLESDAGLINALDQYLPLLRTGSGLLGVAPIPEPVPIRSAWIGREAQPGETVLYIGDDLASPAITINEDGTAVGLAGSGGAGGYFGAAPSPNGHYWQIGFSDTGALVSTDVGTTPPVNEPFATSARVTSVESTAAVTKEAMPSIKDSEFGGRGAGADSIAEDTAALAAFMASTKSAVMLPKGDYRPTGQIATPAGGHKIIKGQGAFELVNDDPASVGDTVIRSSFNGSVFRIASGHGVAIEDLMIYGGAAQTSQVLVDIGDAAGVTATSKFSMKRVHLKGAGQDCLKLRSLVLESDFEKVYCHNAGRYGLYGAGLQINANSFRDCLFRESIQWGVRLEAGAAWNFNGCTIESNSRHASIDYGGILLGGGTDLLTATLGGCYFENNKGVGLTGAPWRMDAFTGNGYKLTDLGSFYSEAAANQINDGFYLGLGPITNQGTFVTMAAGAQGAVFIDPRQYPTGTFQVSGAGVGKSLQIDHDGASGPRLIFGTDRILQRNTGSGYLEVDFLDITNTLDISKSATFTAITAATAPNNALFKDSADGKLKFKDNGGVVNALY